MSRPVRPFLGESAEDRVRTRRQALLDRAFELQASGGWRDASIAQLCREVQLNKRYFYESFPDLQAVADAVVEDLTSEFVSVGMRAVVEAGEAELDTDGLARHVLGACVDWLVEDPRRARVLFAAATDNPRARAQRDRVIDELAGVLQAFGTTYHQAETEVAVTPARQHLAGLASSVLIGGTIEAVLRWLDGKIPLSQQELSDHLARFWVSLGDVAVEIALDDPPR